MAVLEGDGLTKRFGGLVAVADVSFRVEAGEVLGVIGPNGAGKTTLFQLLSGVLAPTEGTVSLHGEDITGLPPHEICHRGLVKTHQIARPFRTLTLRENVAVGAEFGAATEDSDRLTAEALELVGLADVADGRPGELGVSGLKRLEIARALATDPDVVLFDEIAGGLDPGETDEIVELLGELSDRGMTILLVDHVMRAVMSASDRVLVLDSGELVARGTPREIQTDQRVVKAYLGQTAGGSPDVVVGDG